MTDLYQWAARWNVSPLALTELRDLLVAGNDKVPMELDTRGGSESAQQNLIRLAAPHFGIWLTRNNVGALIDETGRPVRYGLANESKDQNKRIKSADLIGIHTFVVQPHHVGQTIGRFVSVECKERGWQYRGTAHELAQKNWADFVVGRGGLACFASEPEHLHNLGVPRK